MTANNFQALCNDICTELKQPEPQLSEETGMMAFALSVSEMPIELLHYPQSDPLHVHVLATIGEIEGDAELPFLLGILAANFLMVGEAHEPAYSRNAETGKLYYQCSYALEELNAPDFLMLLDCLAHTCADAIENMANAVEDAVSQMPGGADALLASSHA